MLILFFNVCARGLFVWLLCRSVKELEDEEDWKGIRRREEGAGGRRGGGFTSAAHVWRGDAGFEQHVPAHLAIAHLPFIPLPISLWSRPLALAGFPRCSFLETIFHHEREERQKIRLQNTKSKINDGDGCAGAEGKEINPAPRSLLSPLVSSNAFVTLSEIWQNFVFRVLDSCYGSSAMHSIIIGGDVVCLLFGVLNHEEQR